MSSDFIVRVEYKAMNENNELETVVEKEYGFAEYTEELHVALMHILADVEDVFYYYNDGKQKDDWTPESRKRFQAIRHKILDEANALKRLPRNLSYKGISASAVPAGQYFARMLNNQK